MALMQKEIETGDVVELKSGGPSMTVVDVVGELIRCVWWDGHDYDEAEFFKQTIQLVK